ncbi:RagB/SusD family nutrient uptake outer membrane protein [Sphingobacterium sp.]|uniref:RagB/SusD family nutrient uptake outer membrane protein n=1 Tax=Sphingobacterium sp. TaxID=341027 RepID=UPI0031DD975D
MKNFKNIYKRWLILSAVLAPSIVPISCTKVLEVENLAEVSQDNIWNDPQAIQILLNNIYRLAEPDNYSGSYPNAGRFRHLVGCITDEGRPSVTYLGTTNGINNGVSFTVDSSPFQLWSYNTIRQINDILKNIETSFILPSGSSQDKVDERNNLIGQAKFFRAYLYWRMVQIYGGVPIVDKVLDENSPELMAPRNTMEECFQFIKKDLEEASIFLPIKASMRGMITKGAALGLLSRVLINRASPLYNPTNNIQFWKDASIPAKQLIELGEYSLGTQADFGQWYFNKDSKETIWQIEFVLGKREHGFDAANHSWFQLQGDGVNICPTQELVDAFPMANGKLIGESGSGYNPNDPYINRDPRLYATVITNGDASFGGTPIYTYLSEGSEVSGNYKYNPNQLNGFYATGTGYYLKKGMDARLLVTKNYNYGRGSYSNWIEMRLAEIMLNYAESENEQGNTAIAYDILHQLRKRAGIASGNGNYGIPLGMSSLQMREYLQNERFIEFAFENKRYWDLRRWRLSEEVLSKATHCISIKKKNNTPPTSNGADYTFTVVTSSHDQSFPPIFLEKFYFLPLPKNELQLNPNLKQNPLW